MMTDRPTKIAVVTGGSAGIGRATVRELGKAGTSTTSSRSRPGTAPPRSRAACSPC
jgi:NAD(P)-dependent dehydrogenase (short-subunit alcohol dehydrogenase family)